MGRHKKFRTVTGVPGSFVYKPAGIRARDLDWVRLSIDEFEVLRLVDHQGLEQAQASELMGVSRPTITRICQSARKKIADALTMGLAIRIDTVEPAFGGSQAPDELAVDQQRQEADGSGDTPCPRMPSKDCPNADFRGGRRQCRSRGGRNRQNRDIQQ